MRPTFTPADPDFDQRVRASFAAQAMMATLGAVIVELGPGWIDLAVPHGDRFTQQHGFAHAGLLATVMDSACGYAAYSLMPAGVEVLTVEYKVNLLRPASADRYTVSGHVVRAGKTITVSQATARSGVDGPELAVMTGTLIAVPADQ